MVAPYVAGLQGILSVDRLERYRPPNGSDLEMVAHYYWNVALCEALYQNLGALETAFRNTLSNTLAGHLNRQDWYDEPSFLQRREAMSVAGAKFDIHASGNPVTAGRIIAQQNFGFWTSLISEGYGIWAKNNHALVIAAFPNAPVHLQYRKRMFEHMNAIRLFRNRVFHYQIVLDGITLQDKARTHLTLPQLHANIIDAIGWIDTVFHGSTVAFDEFGIIHGAGPLAIETKIKAHLGIP